MIQKFPGYDPASPTLIASPLCRRFSNCMRGFFDDSFQTAYVDRAAPIVSGDFVRLWMSYEDGEAYAMIKCVRVSRDGRWWCVCADGVFQIGTLHRPFNIEKVVALSTDEIVKDCRTSRTPLASPEELAHYAELAQEVVDEWREHGHVDGVPFPGLDVLNYFVPGTVGTRNPNYRSPVPL